MTVQVFTYRPGTPLVLTPMPRLALVETRQHTRIDDELPISPHPLGERDAWIVPLLEQLAPLEHVVEAHRQSYRAWHVLGRKVLQVRRQRTGLRLTAGVSSTAPHPSRGAPVTYDLTGPISPAQLDTAMAAVAAARAARLAGQDHTNREAWLQARLASPHGVEALGLVGSVLRELPASRPVGSRAYIDLLGVDAYGTIHLVETKLGDDIMLALQGLDYWVWLHEHLDQVVTELRHRGHHLPDRPKVVIDYVIGQHADRRPATLRTLVQQLEALSGAVAWQLATVTGWHTPQGTRTIDRHPPRHLPDHLQRTPPPRFAVRLRDHLIRRADAAGLLTRRVFLNEPTWTLRAAAGPALAQLRHQGLTHRMVDHVCSSHRFTIELFAGLDPAQRLTLARHLDPHAHTVEPVHREYTDPHDRLREATIASPHATQVDVLLPNGKLRRH